MKPVDGRWTLVATALVCLWLWPSDALAQAEHAPDNYKMSNATAISADPAAKTDFQGTFTLAQDVQCAGHKLRQGRQPIQPTARCWCGAGRAGTRWKQSILKA